MSDFPNPRTIFEPKYFLYVDSFVVAMFSDITLAGLNYDELIYEVYPDGEHLVQLYDLDGRVIYQNTQARENFVWQSIKRTKKV